MSSVSGRQSIATPSDAAISRVGPTATNAYGLFKSTYTMSGRSERSGSNTVRVTSQERPTSDLPVVSTPRITSIYRADKAGSVLTLLVVIVGGSSAHAADQTILGSSLS